MKRTIAAALLILTSLLANGAHAYRLPAYRIAGADRTVAAEEVLSREAAELCAIEEEVGRIRLEEYQRNPKVRLTPSQRAQAGRHERLGISTDFWRQVVGLKVALAGLWQPHADAIAQEEADAIAKTVIETIYALSDEYKVVMLPIFQNFLVNSGIRKKGHCYHYVEDLLKALSSREWTRFDLRWGSAWSGTYRENNALVITAKGAPFLSGLAIDAWRTGGRPFWTPVEGDTFPWVETLDVVVEK